GDATGWNATGGSVRSVLSDTSDATMITSQAAPAGQELDVTFNEISLQPGQPLALRVRARRVSAASGSFVAHLYDGTTLLSTSDAVPVGGTFANVDVTFPAADFEGVTLP